tara:strand:+ start:1622 stop:2803 length:1182 start_codon:yes stop_codon:yes gene_type:complete
MSKNTHLEHLEDELINNGYDGGINAIRFLESLRDMLGTAASGTRITTKWDGAPAIICGTDPETGLFFVGTKSVFNKEPKAAFSDGDVDYYYPGPLNSIMKICLEHLKKLPISGILQGDLLYTKTPTLAKMGGETGYKFRPNTITYFAQQNSPLGDKVAASKMGIVFHTTYSGESLPECTASFGADVSSLQGVKDIAVLSSDFETTGKGVSLTSMEKAAVNKNISSAKTSMTKGRQFLDLLGGKKPFEFTPLFKMYFNQVVRSGKVPSTAALMLKGFVTFISGRFDMEIKKKKTEKARKQWEEKKLSTIKYLNTNKTTIHSAMNAFTALMTAKNVIIGRIQKVNSIGTFIEDESGYRVTSPEGFVAIKNGFAIKLVDRLEFSKANFTVAKNWSK